MEFNKDDFKKILDNVYGEDLQLDIVQEGEILRIESSEEGKAMVIGKHGRNINSLRELVKVYNKLHNTNFQLEV